MAKTSHLFYSADSEQETLHSRIVPSEDQRLLQQESWDNLGEYLKAYLSEETGLPVSSRLQGSYRLHTQVRPASKEGSFDVDLGMCVEWEGAPESRFSAQELKALVQEGLLRYSEETGGATTVIVPAKESCGRLVFPRNFHIDVPVYHLDPRRGVRVLATETEGWKHSDPRSFRVWFTENFADEDSSAVRRLIRYLKIWAALHLPEPPSSMLLTVLAARAYLDLTDDQLDGDDRALLHVAAAVARQLRFSSFVSNPVDAEENINRLSPEGQRSFLEKLDALISSAELALSTPSEATAAKIWADTFHHFFPPIETGASNGGTRDLVPMRFVPDVYVSAVAKNNAHLVFSGENEIGPIPKGCRVDFRIRNARDLPAGTQVQWVVRNRGEEASYVNDLGHLSCAVDYESKEHSAYVGTHHMDVVVTHPALGVLGARRVPVRITGYFAPLRNPPRPNYTKFSRRR